MRLWEPTALDGFALYTVGEDSSQMVGERGLQHICENDEGKS